MSKNKSPNPTASMWTPHSDWTREHSLGLVYVALVSGMNQEPDMEDLAAVTDMLQEWRKDFPPEDVQDLIMEVLNVYTGEQGEDAMEAVTGILGQQLSLPERLRALGELVQVAGMDGAVSPARAALIQTLAESWKVPSSAGEPIEDSGWNVLHDVSLLYIILAHAGDSSITAAETTAMVERLRDWKPELSEKDILQILHTALSRYAEGLNPKLYQAAVVSVHETMPVMDRLLLLEDLAYIAEADGAITHHEVAIIQNLSRTWSVSSLLDDAP